MGEHFIHSNMALAPMTTLRDMMMNQMTHRIQPLEILSTVMANDVLLQSAARMEKVPATLETRLSARRWSGRMS